MERLRPREAHRLTDLQTETLKYAALGLNSHKMAKKMNRSLEAMKDIRKRVIKDNGASNMAQAVLVSIQTGRLMPQDIVNKEAIERTRLLSPVQREILQFIIETSGEIKSDKDLSSVFKISVESARKRILASASLMKVPNRTATIVNYFLATDENSPYKLLPIDEDGNKGITYSEEEREILKFVAMGLSRKQISIKLNRREYLIKKSVARLCKTLDAQNPTHMILIALEKGVLKADDIRDELLISDFRNLAPHRKSVLEVIISDLGRNSTYKDLAKKLGVKEKTVKTYIRDIHYMTRISSTAAIAANYFIFKQNS